MFFRTIDRFFDQIKYAISILTFLLIAMASLLFIYWLLFSANIVMPDFIGSFIWATVDFFAQSFKGSDLYKNITPILPVLTSGVFIILTYFTNCIMLFLENNHKKFQQCVDNYKEKLEKTINQELQKSFLDELKKTNFLMVKIKIVVNNHKSYLTAMTDEDVNTEDVEKHITNLILSTVKSDYILKKGLSNGSVYCLLSDLGFSKEFFSILVSNSVKLINANLRPKLKIGFYCGAEIFNDIKEESEKVSYLDKIIELKIPNKIIITPRFKLFFDNIMPDYYSFKVEGEYNLTGSKYKSTCTMFHSLQKKN